MSYIDIETKLWGLVAVMILSLGLMGCGSTATISYGDRNAVWHVDCTTASTIMVGSKSIVLENGEEVLSAIETLVGEHPTLTNQGHRDRCRQQLEEADLGSNPWGLFLIIGALMSLIKARVITNSGERPAAARNYRRPVRPGMATKRRRTQNLGGTVEEDGRGDGRGIGKLMLIALVALFIGFLTSRIEFKIPSFKDVEQAIEAESRDFGVMLSQSMLPAPPVFETVRAEVAKVTPAPVQIVAANDAHPSGMPWIRFQVRVMIDGTGWTEGDVLWLARAAYSESAARWNMEEVLLLMWTIRNRVDSGYRVEFELPGAGRVYRAVLADRQFSAFNDGGGKYYRNLGWTSNPKNWVSFLMRAAEVLTAPQSDNPLPADTKHFISPETMKALGEPMPKWTREGRVVEETPDFRFYAGVR